MGIGVACQYVEDDGIEQSQRVGTERLAPDEVHHVGDGRATDARPVPLVLGGRWLTQRLAEVLLMQPTPLRPVWRAVVARDQEVAPAARHSGRHRRRRQSAEPSQRQAPSLVLDAAVEAFDVGLEDMGRRRPVERNADPAVGIAGHGQLGLNTGQRHRHAVIANEERLAGELLDDAFEIVLGFDPLPALGAGQPRRTEGERAGGVASDRIQQGEDVGLRDTELTGDDGELLRLGKQVAGPGQEPGRLHLALAQWHGDRDGEGLSVLRPRCGVHEPRPVSILIDVADQMLLKIGWKGHEALCCSSRVTGSSPTSPATTRARPI